MQFWDAFKLKVGDKVDHRHTTGFFVYATVLEKQGTKLKIHYDGWSHLKDTWSDFQTGIDRFAKAGSISKRPAHRFKRLKKGDYVDINPIRFFMPGWKSGEILSRFNGQVQVGFQCAGRSYIYGSHLDNGYEIAEFASRSGTVHAAQADILQKQYSDGRRYQRGQKYDISNKSMQQRPLQHQHQGNVIAFLTIYLV